MLNRRRFDRSGVSEVLGTILVLLITVILFASIIVWVFSIPTPTATGRVSFDGSLKGAFGNGTWSGAYVNLTHLGGDDLTETDTRIFLTIDGTTLTLRTRGTHFDGVDIKSYGVPGPDGTWNIGETWTYLNESIPQDASISVMVVDLTRGTVLWDKALLGAAGARNPIFLDKWADADPNTATRDPVKPDSTFALYAKVVDPDGDLNADSVWAYLTFGFDGTPLGFVQLVDDGDPLKGDAVAGDGLFSRSLSFKAKKAWDGGIVILNATDNGGRETKTRLTLSVVDTSATTRVTGPGSLGFGSEVQRYDIFEEDDWDLNHWDATSQRDFVKGESLVVVVATKTIPSPDLKNSFLLWDPYNDRAVVYSNAPYTQPVTDASLPSSTEAFDLTDYLSGYYIYELRFNTSSAGHGFDGFQLQPGHYPLEFELVTSQTPSPDNRLYVTDSIRVTDLSGNSPDYPKVETYKDADHTQAATTFNFTERMHVKILVKSTDGDFSIGDVVISDFVGRRPVWASPGTSPVSVAIINDAVSYAFSVDLSKPNLDAWNFGTGSYNLEVRDVDDSDESYSQLSTQIKVRGPRWKLDMTMGLMATRHDVFDTVVYGDFFDHTEGWTEYPFETFSPSPGNRAPDNPILGHVLADLDGDGDLDILAGTEDGTVWWYRNKDGEGHSMSRTTVDTLTSGVTAVAVGHIDTDADLDGAVGTSTGDLWWYRNDGAWSANFVDNVGTGVNDLKLADVNGDGAADLVVGLSTGTSSVRVYLNNGQGVFGTVTTEDTLLDADVGSPGHGTTISGTYLATHSSDDLYQQLEEVATEVHLAADEVAGTAGSVQNTFNATHAEDGTVQILTEGEQGAEPQFTLGSPGHRYLFPNITASSLQTLEVHLIGHISSGSEPFQVGWSKDGTNVTWFSQRITNRVSAELVWSLSGVEWTDETLYLHILDIDQSRRDENTDGQLTSLSVDHVFVVETGGGNYSSLARVWRTATLPDDKDAYKFFVEAYQTLNNENDGFVFKFGANPNGPFFDLLTVTKTADDDTSESVSLPTVVGGLRLYVLVQDTDRTNGSTTLDSVFVDRLHFRSYESTPEFWSISVGSATKRVAVADVDGDGHQDVVVATTGTTLKVFYGDGTGKTWPASDSLTSTGNHLTLDVGLINGDVRYDLVVGTDDRKVLLYTNGGSRGAWTLSTVASLSTTTTSSLRVGDVDGDFWDDIVFGTANGFLVYLRNNQGSGWSSTIIIQMADGIDSVDIGDADRNAIIRTHPY